MKKIAILTSVTLSFALLVSFINKPTEAAPEGIALVQTMITGVSGKAIISYPDGTTEEIELDGLNGKKLDNYTKKLTQLLNKMNDKGYRLIETTGGGFGSGKFIYSK